MRYEIDALLNIEVKGFANKTQKSKSILSVKEVINKYTNNILKYHLEWRHEESNRFNSSPG